MACVDLMILSPAWSDSVFRPFLTRVVPVRDATGAVGRWCEVNIEIEALATRIRDMIEEG